MPNANYRDVITIYNCHKAVDNGTKTDIWYSTVIPGCYFKATVAQTVNGTTLSMASSYVSRIPASEKYMPYGDWAKLEDKTGYFTVSENDVVIRGEHVQEITSKSPGTIGELLASRKPEAFRVRSFSDNSGAANGKHYRLSGV